MIIVVSFSEGYDASRDLPSFPTRRSSDLSSSTGGRRASGASSAASAWRTARWRAPGRLPSAGHAETRSEEHTSELQSRRDLVCRLLLEKKKKIKRQPGWACRNGTPDPDLC